MDSHCAYPTTGRRSVKPSKPNPGSLIALGDYYGSLAATRCLGSRGIPIFYADHRGITTGASSRYVTQKLKAPPPTNLIGYGDWLVEYGKSNPGLFLYPASDDIAFVISTRVQELSKHYHLYQPESFNVMDLLDKSRIANFAKQAGLRMPDMYTANTKSGLIEAARNLADAILVKPKTQVGLLTKAKGSYCPDPGMLPAALENFLLNERYTDAITTHDPTISMPIMQRYHPSAVTGMLSISGFVPRDYRECLCLASRKIFQRPRRLGVGVGFSACPTPQNLVDKIVSLCQATNFYGIFEAEFVEDEVTGEQLLVDFNPRYYGQMAFEISRGLPLPALAYYDAIRDKESFEREFQAAKKAINYPQASRSNYALGWIFCLMAVTQSIGRQMTTAELKQWFQWYRDRTVVRYDAIDYVGDPIPKILDILLFLKQSVRHPRDFYRKFFQ